MLFLFSELNIAQATANTTNVIQTLQNFEYFRDRDIYGGDTIISRVYNDDYSSTDPVLELFYDIFVYDDVSIPTVRTIVGFGKDGNLTTGYYEGFIGDAKFHQPRGIALDNSRGGRIYISDTINHVICYIENWRPKTIPVAGIPMVSGYQNGNPNNTQFNRPSGISLTL